MLTIALLHLKGGVGKSTLAVNIAAAAHVAGKRTLVVDLDFEQGSAGDWGRSRPEAGPLDGLAVVAHRGPLTLARFREISRGREVAVLDCPPRADDVTRSAAVCADVVVIPVQPGFFDYWALEGTLKELAGADATRAQLDRAPVRRMFVVNRVFNDREKLAAAAPTTLAEAGEVCPVVVRDRSVYRKASGGLSAVTLDPRGAAAEEMRALYACVAGAAS